MADNYDKDAHDRLLAKAHQFCASIAAKYGASSPSAAAGGASGLVPSAEGKGYAAEAARAVMTWARQSFGWDRLINIIDPRNDRSIALGLRLGGVIDPDAEGEDPGDVVIVHDLTRATA